MFGSIKKAMVVAAVAAAGAMAPAVASADVWSLTGQAHATGQLTMTVVANNAQTTCDVTATLDLYNLPGPPAVAHGDVTVFNLSNCTTTVPGCTVTAVANALPWTIDTSGTNVTITGVNFTNTYAGAACPLSGVAVNATGAVTGQNIPGTNVIEFVSAGSLTTPFGPAVVDGAVEVVQEGTGLPIELV